MEIFVEFDSFLCVVRRGVAVASEHEDFVVILEVLGEPLWGDGCGCGRIFHDESFSRGTFRCA